MFSKGVFKNRATFPVLFMLFFLAMTTGCTGVTEQEFKEALRRCEPHGGLEMYHNPWSINEEYIGDCLCKDGLVIEASSVKKDVFKSGK